MVKDNENSTLKTVQSEGSLKLSRNWDPVPTTKDSKPAELRSRAVDYYSHSRFTLLKMGGGRGEFFLPSKSCCCRGTVKRICPVFSLNAPLKDLLIFSCKAHCYVI